MAKQKAKLRKEARQQIDSIFQTLDCCESIAEGTEMIRKARNLAMKYRLRLPKEKKRKFCNNCYAFLIPSRNCRVRLQDGHVVYTCHECNHMMRFPTD
ncbi:MAG: ribonuclease P protein component 4 [Nanoarchaeota archaeon]